MSSFLVEGSLAEVETDVKKWIEANRLKRQEFQRVNFSKPATDPIEIKALKPGFLQGVCVVWKFHKEKANRCLVQLDTRATKKIISLSILGWILVNICVTLLFHTFWEWTVPTSPEDVDSVPQVLLSLFAFILIVFSLLRLESRLQGKLRIFENSFGSSLANNYRTVLVAPVLPEFSRYG